MTSSKQRNFTYNYFERYKGKLVLHFLSPSVYIAKFYANFLLIYGIGAKP